MPTGSLPEFGKKLWEEVYNKAKTGSCKDSEDVEACAAGSAWKAVKGAGWHKVGDTWQKKAELTEFSMHITKATFDRATQEMRWLATASDTQEDSRRDSMTPELFADFLQRIESNELAPEEFRSDFWQGGMPYLSVSHYLDYNGVAVPGDVQVVYVDGDYLKAKGKYRDTSLGRACWKSVIRDIEEKSEYKDRVRISIAFLDWMHKHKSNGFIFERKSIDDFCPECLRELLHGENGGVFYIKGQLVHLAHTRVPINKRTLMEVDKSMTTKVEDAATIVGEDEAEKLQELETKSRMVGKSEAGEETGALVIKADEEVPAPIVEEAKTKDKKPMMDEEDTEDTPDDEETEDYKDKKKKKEMKKSEAIDPVLEALAEMKAEIAQMKSAVIVEKPTHPLAESLEKFKSDYDEALAMADVTPDDKLRLIQQSFDSLGQRVIETIKTPQIETPATPASEMAKAFSEALQPLMQQMGMMQAQINSIKTVPATVQGAPAPVVPTRRSIQPTPQLQTTIRSNIAQSQTVKKSDTPNLRAIIERTT